MKTLVLASNNAGKLAELKDSLHGLGWLLRAQSDWQLPDVAEPHCTFVENALAKARHAAEHTGHAALADDSGLCVNALNSAPGVHSRRYSASGTDADNNQKLLTALKGFADRRAYFVCTLVLVRFAADPFPLIASGVWQGEISQTPAGDHGFGYDPIFYVPSVGKTAAQLSHQEKIHLSHRAHAIAALRQQMRVF